jgi:uncharacterized membrane protein (DUF106 family)
MESCANRSRVDIFRTIRRAMLELINNLILRVTDPLLGWSLALPRDLALLIVAGGSAAVLTLARKLTTNQEYLARCHRDKQRLRQLIREAKQRGDRDALQRMHRTRTMIALRQMKAEGRPLLAALLPIVLLATWAFQRLEYHPPDPGEPVAFNAYFPMSAVGRTVHVVPQDGLEAADGWIREVTAVTDAGPPYGLATWTLSAAARTEPYELVLRRGDRTWSHALRVGLRIYEPPLLNHDEELVATEIKLRAYKPFGVVPGIAAAGLPAWLVGYVLVVALLAPALKRTLKIH